mmetsp:Transcript_2524/g.5897  ORF Transcript_2524/g.5897 Transcript_2524/m.5897 type:complete len:103 (-) Transcript_2524:3-311(-)
MGGTPFGYSMPKVEHDPSPLDTLSIPKLRTRWRSSRYGLIQQGTRPSYEQGDNQPDGCGLIFIRHVGSRFDTLLILELQARRQSSFQNSIRSWKISSFILRG